ncbi:MAG: hypothetical protein ACW99Q_13740 [Candidatus Kariarchaeaceae archaeon]
MKPKVNKGYNTGTYDECQTPPYALEPLFPYLFKVYPIWECAAGKRTLTRELKKKEYTVLHTDISDTPSWDFFSNELHFPLRCTIVTNPPYSLKYEWLQRCYYLGFPFALLMPVEMLGTAKGQRLFDKYGIEVIFMSPRVDFYMPNKGYEGGGAQFPTAWFTWKLNLPKEINFARLNKPKRSELKEYWEKALAQNYASEK